MRLSELTNPDYYTQKILFSIGQTTGELQVNRMLDRERQRIYYFQVCVNCARVGQRSVMSLYFLHNPTQNFVGFSSYCIDKKKFIENLLIYR